MPNRLLRVNAYTTFDMLDAEAVSHEFTEEAFAVLNVTAPRKNPDHVRLELELDNSQLDHLPAHAEKVTLTAEQARTLAGELEEYAGRVEAAQAEDDGDDRGDGEDGNGEE
ncbi:DUF6360 family protein [Halogeometricum sp. S1BR25-6]|uniref:DUF6360 family protein n=1 Tax=Halogeometricum salsisoli TaxID=2950536 RepID=A0ABU2GGR3_9EURY|nr:DUF6360 family protein [Halogeometricum sp. S1BR25-6]MDS0299985.1 DUF6360 family protein [Halogeometricum sp. S1BR25-6]